MESKLVQSEHSYETAELSDVVLYIHAKAKVSLESYSEYKALSFADDINLFHLVQ